MDKKILVFLVVSLLLNAVSFVEAQQAILIVRHGDTVRQKANPDVQLSEAGEHRTLALPALLKDSGINVIYTTGLQRTVKTAEPLAELLGVDPKIQPETPNRTITRQTNE